MYQRQLHLPRKFQEAAVRRVVILASSSLGFSVIYDGQKVMVQGRRRARQNLPPLPADGYAWLPSRDTQLWVDGVKVAARGGLVRIGPKIQGRTRR
ncbi:MAG: hypothetical protein ABI693_02945 [Bryobacteraceae bacterium]